MIKHKWRQSPRKEEKIKEEVCDILIDYLKKITDTDRNRTDSEIQSVSEVTQALALFLF